MYTSDKDELFYSKIDDASKATINAQFAGLIQTAKEGINTQTRFLVARDISGSMTSIATGCGMNTEMGKIANLLENAENKQTPLQRKLDDFGKKLGVVIVLLAMIIFAVQVFRGSNVADSFMFAIAIAMAAITRMVKRVIFLPPFLLFWFWCWFC